MYQAQQWLWCPHVCTGCFCTPFQTGAVGVTGPRALLHAGGQCCRGPADMGQVDGQWDGDGASHPGGDPLEFGLRNTLKFELQNPLEFGVQNPPRFVQPPPPSPQQAPSPAALAGSTVVPLPLLHAGRALLGGRVPQVGGCFPPLPTQPCTCPARASQCQRRWLSAASRDCPPGLGFF